VAKTTSKALKYKFYIDENLHSLLPKDSESETSIFSQFLHNIWFKGVGRSSQSLFNDHSAAPPRVYTPFSPGNLAHNGSLRCGSRAEYNVTSSKRQSVSEMFEVFLKGVNHKLQRFEIRDNNSMSRFEISDKNNVSISEIKNKNNMSRLEISDKNNMSRFEISDNNNMSRFEISNKNNMSRLEITDQNSTSTNLRIDY
jgi:hypothetical protein